MSFKDKLARRVTRARSYSHRFGIGVSDPLSHPPPADPPLTSVGRARDSVLWRRVIPVEILILVLAGIYRFYPNIWLRVSRSDLWWQATRFYHSLTIGRGLSILGLISALVLWIAPKRRAARLRRVTAKDRFDRENEARKTLAQIIGGGFVLVGLYYSSQTLSLQVRTLALQQKGQVTDRFSKAIEQLGVSNPNGTPKVEVTLGAISALEQIAFDSDRYRWPIMEVLAAYVRTKSPRVKGSKTGSKQALSKGTSVYIQSILMVIGRRDTASDPSDRRIDLSETSVPKAIFSNKARLRLVNFWDADLRETYLYLADLRYAVFEFADLRGAHVLSADLGSDRDGRRVKQ